MVKTHKDFIEVDIELGAGGLDTKIGEQFALASHEGISDGLDDAGDSMLDSGESHARDIVMGSDRVWNKKVKRGFQTEKPELQQRWYHYRGRLKNVAPHAKIVEEGLAPAGKITGSNPSVQDIIPWVDDEVQPNSTARAKAENANPQRWKTPLKNLAEEYGTATVITAFAIRESIAEEGYPGIQFMEATENYLRSSFHRMIKMKVEKHLRRQLRQKGFT
jgi:hypothetical protein